jgi:shikimate dehydrogenase
LKKYGLIGQSLGHSFSKSFFEEKFSKEGILATYENFEFQKIDEVSPFLKADYSGFNVTIPYKRSIINYLDELSDDATDIGAVNTVQFVEGRTIGHNTDIYGFHQSVKPFLTFKHERAIILGTGGASKAVRHVLNKLGIDVIFISRTPKGENCFSYGEINEHMLNACKLIINCTPLGTFPKIEECPEMPFEFLTEDHLCVDLIYNPAQTEFLKRSKEAGATILNGRSMLEQQAAKSWEIWNS